MEQYDKTRQFHFTVNEFMAKLDLVNWYRYFFISKRLTETKPKNILEMGPGEGTLVRLFSPFTERYETMDVNDALSPTYKGDIREYRSELKDRFDCVIAADILEHIPFENLEKALSNIHSYLRTGGEALITIPHRASYFLFMSPTNIPHVVRLPFASLRAFYRRYIIRKVSIDLDHAWEIGDGNHKISDVEAVIKKAGFAIESRKRLLYVDFWTLKK